MTERERRRILRALRSVETFTERARQLLNGGDESDSIAAENHVVAGLADLRDLRNWVRGQPAFPGNGGSNFGRN